jgi:hypothetical protein
MVFDIAGLVMVRSWLVRVDLWWTAVHRGCSVTALDFIFVLQLSAGIGSRLKTFMSYRTSTGFGLGVAALLAMAVAAPYVLAESSRAVVAKYDKDHDRTLDWNEVEAAAGARFDKLDQNGDGTLDRAEAKGIMRRATFRTADTDRDGTLSKNEYLALVKQRFTAADTDNDATLSAKELNSRAGHNLKLLID